MRKNIKFVFDDIMPPNRSIEQVVGCRRFGQIVFKRKALVEHIKYAVMNDVDDFIILNSLNDYSELSNSVREKSSDCGYIHFFWLLCKLSG